MKWTASKIRECKGKQKIACLTAYDYSMARLVDEAGIPLVLVGDSLAMTMLGYCTTLPVTMAEMLHHTAAVSRGVKSALVVGDMPFMSYQVSIEKALENAGRFIKEAAADAVKIEGGAARSDLVGALVSNGIPVLGHIGLTPQSVRALGGFKVQGKEADDARRLVEDAQALQAGGVFAIVVECVPAELGKQITKAVTVPTIGIGAGRDCDGQVLVTHDLLGLYSGVSPKFVKRYAELGDAAKKALVRFSEDVQRGAFPDEEHSY